jgi:hypothetical protein
MLKAPKWCSNAVPTNRGWTNPTTGELYVAKRFSQEQIDEFNGVQKVAQKVEEVVEDVQEVAQVEEVVVEDAPQMLHEAPVGNKSLSQMTKAELIALAEQTGVEVSARDTKAVLVEKLQG